VYLVVCKVKQSNTTTTLPQIYHRELASLCDSALDSSIFLQQINKSFSVSSAFNNVLSPLDIIEKISVRINKTRIIYHQNFINNATLKLLNAGFGTTGTTAVHEMIWKDGMATLHWQNFHSNLRGSEKNRVHNLQKGLWEIIFKMSDCREAYRKNTDKGRSSDCETEKFARVLMAVLKELISNGVSTLSDTPFVKLFPEILSLLPDVKVFHTLRPPLEWSRRRIEQHGKSTTDFICASQRADNITSFFNMMECIEGSKYVGQYMRTPLEVIEEDAEVVGTDKAYENFAAKFVAHNMYVKKFTPSENYYPLCAWDGDFETQVEKALKQALG
jgi:hypothetical protein